MREVSVTDFMPKQDTGMEKLAASLEKAMAQAMRDIKPPKIEVSQPAPNVEITNAAPEKGAFIMTVNRDDQGRVYSMVVKPYEPV